MQYSSGISHLWCSPLLLLQTSNNLLQLPSFLLLHSLKDLGRTLRLAAQGAFPSQSLAVLNDEGMFVIPVDSRESAMSKGILFLSVTSQSQSVRLRACSSLKEKAKFSRMLNYLGSQVTKQGPLKKNTEKKKSSL